jgi:hypothetical protein
MKGKGDHLCRPTQRSKTVKRHLKWIKCLGCKRKISRTFPTLSPVDTHFLYFAKFLFLKINLKARLPNMNYKAQLSVQVAFDNAKQSGANKVTTCANQMNQLLNMHNPALTPLPKEREGRKENRE